MSDKKFDKLFVGGDLSGIQNFLYNITPKRAAKSLKGRSAFISAFLKDVCDEIIRAAQNLGLHVKELYCSGGKFYIVTENTEEIKKRINEITRKNIEKLWEDHYGLLGLNVAYISFREIQDGNKIRYQVEENPSDPQTTSGVLWKYITAKFQKLKNQKFLHLIEGYTDFFDVQEVGGDIMVCAFTGVESEKCVPLSGYDDDNDNEPIYVLPAVKDSIEYARTLSYTQEGKAIGKDTIKSFSEYADGTYLGVLSMDVDGLGSRFIHGFDTLEEYEKFSQHVTEFFEGKIGGSIHYDGEKFINMISRPSYPGERALPYSEYLNVIYAGGDDLFIIGRWDKILEFARLIHDKTESDKVFLENSYYDNGTKKHISISGGIAVVKPKFPISKAAELSKAAEEDAKNFPGKNAFTIFGRTLSWKEFDIAQDLKETFVKFISSDNIEFGTGLLQRIMTWQLEAERGHNNYIWNSSYSISRFMEKFKVSPKDSDRIKDIKKERWDFCLRLRNEFCAGRKLLIAAVAARWAELELRNINKENPITL